MTTGGGAGLGAVRSLAASAAGAEDGRLMRLVRLLDAVPERGEADRVLEAARPRLGVLRPARPLRFARLLFAPLDGAIAPVARQRRGGHELPRSALGPLAGAVAAALGPAAAAVLRDAEGAPARRRTRWPRSARGCGAARPRRCRRGRRRAGRRPG